jgi:hypothetical protein
MQNDAQQPSLSASALQIGRRPLLLATVSGATAVGALSASAPALALPPNASAVDTMSELKKELTGGQYDHVLLMGYGAAGDGGGGQFYWDGNSTEDDNFGTIIKPEPPAGWTGPGRWKRLLGDANGWNVKWFGPAGTCPAGTGQACPAGTCPAGTGQADDYDTFQKALDAIGGSGCLWENCVQSLYVPTGQYNIGKTLHLKNKISGLLVQGDGIWSTLIRYTGTDVLIKHDTLADGQVKNVFFRDIGFQAAQCKGTCVDLTCSVGNNSGAFKFSHVLFRDFNKVFALHGDDIDDSKDAGLDSLDCYSCIFRDNQTILYSDNKQAVNLNFIACESGADEKKQSDPVFVHLVRGGEINLIGGHWIGVGTGALFRIDENATPFGGWVNRVIGTKMELRGCSSYLVEDKRTAPTSFAIKATFVFQGVNAVAFPLDGSKPHEVVKLSAGAEVVFRDGRLYGGVKLGSLDPSIYSRKPAAIYVDDSMWFNKTLTEVYNGNPANRPIVIVRDTINTNNNGEIAAPLDQETGPRTSSGNFTRRRKVAFLAKRYNGYWKPSLPDLPGDENSVGITIPLGSQIAEIRLVCYENHKGQDGKWKVTNGNGTKIYIEKVFGATDKKFVETLDTMLFEHFEDLLEVNWPDSEVVIKSEVINGQHFSEKFAGFVQVTYI